MPDRTIKPTPTGKIEFNPPDINILELNNSSKVYHVNKNTLPIVQINLIIPAGSIYSPENKFGISSLTAMLIDEGAGNLTGLEVSDKIESLGSILNISSSKEFATLSMLTLKENLEKSLEIFSLIIQSPSFNKSDFMRESQRLQTQILQLNDDPGYVASNKFQKIIYDSTQYQHPSKGTISTIPKLANNDVEKFYEQNYQPGSSFFVVVGDLNGNEINDLFNRYFNSWHNKGLFPSIKTNITSTKRQIILIDKPDAAQSEIRMGHFSKKRTSKDFYANTVLNSILGGQFSSRINLNLREDKGFTYGAHSSYNYNQLGSTFIVSTSVKTENTDEAINEILIELKNAKTTISKEELNFSKSYLIRRYPSLFETYSQVASNISLLPIYNLRNEYFLNYIENIENVSLEEVLKAANENILLNELVIVVVGNKNVIENDLVKLSTSTDFEFIVST